MKKITLLFLLFSLFSNSQNTYVPDNNFEQELINLGLDTVLDDYVLTSNISGITNLNISNKSINSLTGIEDFTSLLYLQCQNNNISSIDVSNLTNLQMLRCQNNNIYTLNVAANTALTELNFEGNNISSIDLSTNTALTKLFCQTNNLTELDLSNNSLLTNLSCFGNNLEELDISNMPNMTYFDARTNNLIRFNAKNGNNTGIISFWITQNPNLLFACVDNVSYANSNFNKDTATIFTTNCNLTQQTYVPDDNFEQELINLGFDGALDNNVYTPNINTVTSLNLNNKSITDLTGISGFANLSILEAGGNDISTADFSKNALITSIVISGNSNLNNLNVVGCTELQYLEATACNLTSMVVTNNNKLQTLNLNSNYNLTGLTLPLNGVLNSLNCGDTALPDLDVSNQPHLTDLRVFTTPISFLNAANGNTQGFTVFQAANTWNLFYICIDDPIYATNNPSIFWIDDWQASFTADCNIAFPKVNAKVFLQGALPSGTITMNDDLRSNSLLPTTSPYFDGNTCNANVFDVTSNNAIVDWVFIELRDGSDNTSVVDFTACLLQKDGNVVYKDGVSVPGFNVPDGNYYVAIKHRNHLGIMTSGPIALASGTITNIDFSNGSTTTFGTNSQVVDSGNYAMWAGDVDDSNSIKFSGASNDSNPIKDKILSAPGNVLNLLTYSYSGYHNEDINLNGNAKFSGSGNDSNLIKDNVLNHPGNILNLLTYSITEQLP